MDYTGWILIIFSDALLRVFLKILPMFPSFVLVYKN